MKTDDQFQSNYIKADIDLVKKDKKGIERPIDMDVTISGCVKEEFPQTDGSFDEKIVLYFEELVKGLVINKTNWKTLMRLYPVDDTDEWIGEQITLYAGETTYMGEPCWGTRIRMAPPGELEYV
jgi:hypothetical protein